MTEPPEDSKLDELVRKLYKRIPLVTEPAALVGKTIEAVLADDGQAVLKFTDGSVIRWSVSPTEFEDEDPELEIDSGVLDIDVDDLRKLNLVSDEEMLQIANEKMLLREAVLNADFARLQLARLARAFKRF